MKKRLLSMLLTLTMLLSLVPAMGVTASAETLDPVSYIDADGKEQICTDYTVVNNTMTGTWNAGWYVVNSDVTRDGQITCTGAVHLILADGYTLTASAGIYVAGESNSLTIYGQSGGTGTLIATGNTYSTAGIGGGDDNSGQTLNGGDVTINGGTVTATGGANAAGIGGSKQGNGGKVTVNGGTLTATGGKSAAGIGGGFMGNGGNVTVNGGTLMATGGGVMGGGGAGIGGGNSGNGGSVTVNGGTVTAIGGNNSKGIGCGYDGTDDGTLTVDEGMTIKAGANEAGATQKDFTPNQNCISALGGAAYVKIKPAQTPVSYIDASGATKTCTDYTVVTSSDAAVTWTSGWYVVNSEVTISNASSDCVTASGDVKLILCDGATLTMTAQAQCCAGIISLYNYENLTIYGQSNGTGKLISTGKGYGMRIGGTFTVNGGVVEASCNGYGMGIWAPGITINGGSVKASGGSEYNMSTPGISGNDHDVITVNGGTVTSIGGSGDWDSNVKFKIASGYVYKQADSVEALATATATPGTGEEVTTNQRVVLIKKAAPVASIDFGGEIGEKKYTTVQEAITAAKSGNTIKMIADSSEKAFTLPDGVTLDTNGKTLNTTDGWTLAAGSVANLGTLTNGTDLTATSKTGTINGTVYAPSGTLDLRGVDLRLKGEPNIYGGTAANPTTLDTLKATRVFFGDIIGGGNNLTIKNIILENYTTDTRAALGVYYDSLTVDTISVNAAENWYWTQQYQPKNYNMYTGFGGKLTVNKKLTTGEFLNANYSLGNIGTLNLADGAVVNCVDFQNNGNVTEITKTAGTVHVNGSGATLNTAALNNHAITTLGTVNLTAHPVLTTPDGQLYSVNYGTDAELTIGTLNFKNLQSDSTKNQFRIGDNAKTTIGGLTSSAVGADIYVTGASDTSVNKNGGNAVKYTGDIVFTKYSNSDTTNAKFSMTLDSSDDYFTGSVRGTASVSNCWRKWGSAVMGNETANADGVQGMTLTMSGGSKWNMTEDSIINTLSLSGSSISGACALTVTSSAAIDATSTIAATTFTNKGVITVDMTGATADVIQLIDCSGTASYGTAGENYKFAAGKDNGYTLKVVGNDLYAVKSPLSAFAVNAIWSKSTGEAITIGNDKYYYGFTAFSQLADAIGAVTSTPAFVIAYGNGNIGNKETESGEGIKFTVPGTYTVSGTEWANLGYLQLNPDKNSTGTRYVLNIGATGNGANLVVTKSQLRGYSDMNITNSHVDFANQKDAGAGYLFAFKDSTVNVKNSVVGYNTAQGNSSAITAGATSTTTNGNMSSYISGIFNADTSTIYTALDDGKTYSFAIYDRGLASLKDSVLYSCNTLIGCDVGVRTDRASAGREGEIATLELDNSKLYANSGTQSGLTIGKDKAGKLVLKKGSVVDVSAVDITVTANGTIELGGASSITAKSITNNGTMNWDIASNGGTIDWSKLTNNGTLKLAVGSGTKAGDCFTLAKNAATANATFTLTGISGQTDTTLTVGNSAVYNKLKFTLSVITAEGATKGNLILTVSPNFGVSVDEALKDKWFKKDEAVTLTGTYISDATPTITVGDAEATVNAETKTWSYTYSSAPADTKGTEVNVVLNDGTNTVTEKYTLKIDTTAPEITITPTKDGYVASGNDVHWYQNSTTVSIKATATDATSEVASMTKDGSAYTAGTNGLLTTSAEMAQARTHTFGAADNAGNSGSEDFKYNVDGSAPTVADVAVSNSYESATDCYWVKKGDTVTVSATVTDTKSGVKEVKFDGAAATATSDVFSKAHSTATEYGLHEYTIDAKDNVENSASKSIYVGVDGTAPVITDNTPDLVNPAEMLSFILNATDTNGSGVKEAKYAINGGTKIAYTIGSSLTIEENCTLIFYFYDNVGNESTKEYAIENLTLILGSDGEEITDEAAKTIAKTAITETNTLIKAQKGFNGNGSDAAESSSIASVLGAKGHVDVKLTSVGLNKKVSEADASSKVITYTFDVTPYDNAGVEQHKLTKEVTFRLPINNPDKCRYAVLYHEGKFVKEYALGNADYIEVISKTFSEYSYTLTNSSLYSSDSYSVKVSEAKNGSVTISPKNATVGATVTITVTPDKGYTLETLTVKDAKGNEIELTAKKLGETYTFKMPSSKVTVTATFMEDNTMLNFFVDVKASDYFYDAVLWAATNGITCGVDNLHFAPNAITTRGQMVTFLWRAAGSPEPTATSSTFTDVVAGSYYDKAVLWAVEKGITKGVSETSFAPNATVTRGQCVTFLYRYEGSPAVSVSNSFTDVKATDYYNNAVAWAATNKITTGATATTFDPNSNCTRGQIVTFLYRDIVK